MAIYVTWSPDDNGYYAEVYGMKSGQTLYTTPILKSERSALANAKRWVAKMRLQKTNGVT